eukprot:355307_1
MAVNNATENISIDITRSTVNDISIPLTINKDIYNTYVVLCAKITHTETGTSTIWDSMPSVQRVSFCFLLWLIFIIQAGGFFAIYIDATESISISQELHPDDTNISVTGGFIEFSLPNDQFLLENTSSNTLNISSGSITSFDVDKVVIFNGNSANYSLLFAILVGDLCVVLALLKNVYEFEDVLHLSLYLSEFSVIPKTTKIILCTRLVMYFLAAIAASFAISVSTTSMEAIERSVASFFLFETASWVYPLISQYPAVYDDLFEAVIDLEKLQSMNKHSVVNDNEETGLSNLSMIYTQRIMEAQGKIESEMALSSAVIKIVMCFCLFIGIQFLFVLDLVIWGWILVIMFVILIVIDVFRKKRTKREAQKLVELQLELESQV